MKHGLCTEWTEDGRLTKDITYDYDTPISEYLLIYHGDGYIEMNRRSIKKFLKDNNYVIDDVEIEEILIELEIFCNSNSNSNSD